MNWSDWIAVLTLVFTLWVYIKHDKEIKVLEKEKLKREALENKRAQLDMKGDWLFVRHMLYLQNIGKSTAKNIVIALTSEEPLTFQDGTTKYRIDQLEVMEKAKPIPLIGGHQHIIPVKLTWDDDSGKGLTKTFHIEDKEGNEFMRI